MPEVKLKLRTENIFRKLVKAAGKVTCSENDVCHTIWYVDTGRGEGDGVVRGKVRRDNRRIEDYCCREGKK